MENFTIQQINHLILALNYARKKDFAIDDEKGDVANKNGGKRLNELYEKLYKIKWSLKEQS
tara:strand:- start:19 stop:201 length:183 start_codon:yes stop_codon:yes gene_type:complete